VLFWSPKPFEKQDALMENKKTPLYKTHMRPVLTYRLECWELSKQVEGNMNIFERNVLKRIFVTIHEDGSLRSRYNEKL
jgi:hypothetical protein